MRRFLITAAATIAVLAAWVMLALVAAANFYDPGI